MELQELYTLLCQGHVQAQGVMDTLPIPIIVLDDECRVRAVNPAFLASFGVARHDAEGHSFFALGNGQWDIPELRRLVTEVLHKAAAVIDFEVTHDFPGIGPRTMLVGARRLAAPGRHGKEILVTLEDVTARHRSDAAKDLLLGETRHRMGNLLGVVRALASQTRTAGRSGEEYRDDLLGRLEAVAHAQEASLTGGDAMDLGDVLVQRLAALGAGRIRLEGGPPVRLAGAQMLPLSLILHELATNSLKYGAFSSRLGEVRVGWEVLADGVGPRLRLTWQESGGPRVRPPRRRGFGMRLIEASATATLQGEAALDFETGGLRATLTIPLQQAPIPAPAHERQGAEPA
jgi:two-component sensor histidine kinase